jgi:hypothetical protein
MGRSVSYASGSIAIAYQYNEQDHDFEYTIEDIREYAKSLWPSFSNCDKWLDREDHAMLENKHAYIGISEYCGLISVWLVPKNNDNLSSNFCYLIKNKFVKSFSTLNKIGRFSNGESVFEGVKHDTV